MRIDKLKRLMQILVTGGTGFIGNELVKHLVKKNYNVIILTRDTSLKSQNKVKYISDLSLLERTIKINIIINLAGADISRRWSKDYKKILKHSRSHTTQTVISLIKRLETKPELLINASAIGYYGDQNGLKLDEESVYVNDFTHQICQEWEERALRAKDLGVRVCIARLGVVLGKNGGALAKMTQSFKFKTGFIVGDGKQLVSWVHMYDVISIFQFFIDDKKLEGFFNIVAPHATSNKNLIYQLGNLLGGKILLKIPKSLIKTCFGEMGEKLLLASCNVVPKALTKHKYEFKYKKIEEALADIYESK